MAYIQNDAVEMGTTTPMHVRKVWKQFDAEALVQSEPDFDLVYRL